MLLSGDSHLFLLSLAVVSVVFSVWLSKRLDIIDDEGHPSHIFFSTLRYWPWLIKEIMVANIDVAKALLKGGNAIEPSVFVVKATQGNDLGHTVYANSITLTPGTISIELEHDEITVHALTRGAAEGLKSGEMDHRVSTLFDEAEDAA